MTPERAFASIGREHMYVIQVDQSEIEIHADRGVARGWHVTDMMAARARWAMVALAAVVLLGLGYAKEASSSPLVAGPVPAAAQTVTVAPGDTLWSIASRRYPNADVRQKVFEIEQLNDLSGPTIVAGQRLRVPAR
ncbi:MAG TPA: LysM peptidoglycan-binding domain-containing protein [Candidatus Dormibacteraeota bacterium]